MDQIANLKMSFASVLVVIPGLRLVGAICLGMVYQISGMNNVQALTSLLNQAVRKLSAIVRMNNFRGTPTRDEQIFKLSFDRGSVGSPDWQMVGLLDPQMARLWFRISLF